MAKIKYYGELRRTIGKQEEEFSISSIKALLDNIRKHYGKPAYLQAKASLISINGYRIESFSSIDTMLDEDSTVCFFPIATGG